MYCAGVLTFDGGFMGSSSSRTKCVTDRCRPASGSGCEYRVSPGRAQAGHAQAMRIRMRGLTLAIMTKHRIYATSFASVYPLYVAKAKRKGRTKAEVDQIVVWLTGYSQKQFEDQLESRKDLEAFFADAPHLNPARTLIRGMVCGVRVEDIKEPTMREIRYLDKLIEELAKGKPMEKILRK
jgi:hypothetical protein